MIVNSPQRYRADIALLGVCIVWGCTFVVVQDAIQHASTLLFLAIRFSVATTALALAFPRSVREIYQTKPIWLAGATAGIFLFLGYLLQTVGLRYTTPSKSAFLTSTSIIMVPFLAAIFERKPPGLSEIAGIALATAGMALMTLRFDTLTISRGDLLTLGCAAAFAVQILLVGHFAAKVGFRGLAISQIATAAVLALGTCWWVETPHIRWTPEIVSAFLITGLLATALAFAIQSWAQQFTTATRTALIFSTEPVFAWVTSYLVAGEVLSARTLSGAALILAGILTVELKPLSLRQATTGD